MDNLIIGTSTIPQQFPGSNETIYTRAPLGSNLENRGVFVSTISSPSNSLKNIANTNIHMDLNKIKQGISSDRVISDLSISQVTLRHVLHLIDVE